VHKINVVDALGYTSDFKVGAIIVAAGSGSRMKGVDKVFEIINGHPILSYTVETFERCASIDQIVIVLSRQNLKAGRELVTKRGWKKIVSVCEGGKLRQDSVRLGLSNVSDCEWVIVHDGVRPCITQDLIMRCLDSSKDYDSSIAAVPVKDTIKSVSSLTNSDCVEVESTLPRNGLWIAQTPQMFRYKLLLEAHQNAKGNFTDDAAMIEAIGGRVGVVMGSYGNIKITTQEDLVILEHFLEYMGKQ